MRRRMMMNVGKTLPYDAKVEYLSSNGVDNMFIDSRVMVQEGLEITCEFSINRYTSYGYIFGNQNDANWYAFARQFSTTGRLQAGFPNNGVVADTVVLQPNERHVLVMKIYDGEQSCAIDGRVFASKTAAVEGTSNQNIRFFSAGRLSTGLPGDIKIYKADILLHGVPIRDYIMVRKDGIGYFYDRVNEELYGNAGDSQFTYGLGGGITT